MGEDERARGSDLAGALIGWDRNRSRHGCVITLQLVQNAAEYKDHRYHRVSMALNDRQLRSLARDLARAARSRGLDLRARPPLHRRFWQGFKSMILR